MLPFVACKKSANTSQRSTRRLSRGEGFHAASGTLLAKICNRTMISSAMRYNQGGVQLPLLQVDRALAPHRARNSREMSAEDDRSGWCDYWSSLAKALSSRSKRAGPGGHNLSISHRFGSLVNCVSFVAAKNYSTLFHTILTLLGLTCLSTTGPSGRGLLKYLTPSYVWHTETR